MNKITVESIEIGKPMEWAVIFPEGSLDPFIIARADERGAISAVVPAGRYDVAYGDTVESAITVQRSRLGL